MFENYILISMKNPKLITILFSCKTKKIANIRSAFDNSDFDISNIDSTKNPCIDF